MAWTLLATARPRHLGTATITGSRKISLNVHIKANLDLLKTNVDDDGSLRDLVKGFAFSAGQGNVGTGDDQLTSYNVVIPAGYMSQPGDALLVEGHYALANNTNSKQGKFQLSGSASPIRTIWSTAAAVASHIVPFWFQIVYRAATSGALTGYAMIDAASGGAPTNYLFNFGLTLNAGGWADAQTLQIYAVGVADNDVVLRDYTVWQGRGVSGGLV
jgi:hypothetical protein